MIVIRAAGIILLALVLTIPACASGAPTAATGSTTRSKPAPRKKTDTAASPAIHLSVQGETVEADEIWLPYMDDLERIAKSASRADLENKIARQSAQLITDKIAEMLLYQRAKLRLTAPLEKKFDEFVDAEIRKRVTAKYDGVQRRMERELEEHGWSLDEYREHVRRSVIISTYLDEELRPKVAEPSRAELLAAFEQSAESLRKPPRRGMSLIDVRVAEFLPAGRDATDVQRADARTQAKARVFEAQSELRKGISFPDVAKKYSHASNAADGGAWGFVSPESVQDRYAPALAKLNTLQQGQVSEVIETPDSFFLVKCDAFDPGSNPDFQSVQSELREQLFSRVYSRKVADLVAELRTSARIEPENLEPFHSVVTAAAIRKCESMGSKP